MPPNAPVGDGHYRCRYDQGSRNFAEISEIEKPPFLKTDLLSECVRDPLLVKLWPSLRCVAQLYLNDDFNEFLAPALDAFEDELIVARCSGLDHGEPHSSFTIGTSSVEQRIVPLRIQLGVQLTSLNTDPALIELDGGGCESHSKGVRR